MDRSQEYRKLLTSKIDALMRINACLVSLGPSFEENISRLLMLCREITSAPRVAFFRMNGSVFQRVACTCGSICSLLNLDAVLRVVAEQQISGVFDVSLNADLPLADDASRSMSCASVLGTYLTIDAEPIGVLLALYEDPCEIDDEVKQELSIVAQAMVSEEKRRRTNEQILRQSSIISATVDAARDAIVMTDQNGHIVYWNRSAEAIFGCDASMTLGKDVHSFFLNSESTSVDFSERHPDGGVEQTYGRRLDGTLFPVECTTSMPFIEGEWRAITIVRDVSAQIVSERNLRESEAQYHALADGLPDAVFVIDSSDRVVFANRQALMNLQLTAEDMKERSAFELVPCMQLTTLPELVESVRQHHLPRVDRVELMIADKPACLEMRVFPITINDDPDCVLYIGRNITQAVADRLEAERLREQLLQSQRLESIGRLAGGVAHDFNNILTVVLSNLDFAFESECLSEEVREMLVEVKDASARAVDLTRNLLAFSRKQKMQLIDCSLGEIVGGVSRMLVRMIGEDISFDFATSGTCHVHVDKGQIEQVIMNLAINARDAMPSGGTLRINTTEVMLTRAQAKRLDVDPGPYVQLRIQDTGTGIAQDHLEKIFEPFFTTKPVGKGTGLGLSMVYGTVRQHNGGICVESEIGKGTSFYLYFPRLISRLQHEQPKPSVRRMGVGNVLVVEDDEAVLRSTKRMVERLGYVVLAAKCSEEALHIAADKSIEVDLLFTDVVMPGMSGLELWERVRLIRPKLRVLFASGYTRDVEIMQQVLTDGLGFIEKPFSLDVLSVKMSEILAT